MSSRIVLKQLAREGRILQNHGRISGFRSFSSIPSITASLSFTPFQSSSSSSLSLLRNVATQTSQRRQCLTLRQSTASVESRRWLSSSEGNKSAEEAKKDEEWFEAKKRTEEGTEGQAADAAAPEGAASDAEVGEPQSKEELLELEVKELKNQLLRSYAEQENTRKIAMRDVDSARQFAIKSFAKSLLDVSDNLTRALESVPAEMRKSSSESADSASAVLASLYEGIEMTDRGLLKAFQMNGLERFGEVGEAFDPNKHDALLEYPDPEKKPGTVGQVIKPGFMLHKRVLRPAEVGVVKEA
ncbi:hypothetical protein ACA910_018290 [Epithemia clementina (nom. ined.)]